MSPAIPAEDQALLARIPNDARARNGIPDEVDAAARERAVEIAGGALGDLVRSRGVRTSILGPGWSQDIDLHVKTMPDPARLAALGWVGLDGLLGRLGYPGEGRWAIFEDGAALAQADLTSEPVPEPAASVLARCRRRGQVRAREVLELRALLRGGATLPRDDPVLAVAAAVEAGMGGGLLQAWRDGPPLPAPATLPSVPRPRFSRSVRWVASRLRPRRRVVVAISGLDGAGKTTLAKRLATDFRRVRLPSTMIWTRPGMGLRWLGRIGRTAKRLLRQEASPGIERIGSGESAGAVASRRGAMGWLWALMVTSSFIREVRREHRRGRGILLYDRHLLDALVTLDVVYEGVPLRLHRALVRLLVPRADVTLLLVVPPGTALARKPDDMFVQEVLERQSAGYTARRGDAPRVRELDGTRPPDDLAADAFRLIAAIGAPL